MARPKIIITDSDLGSRLHTDAIIINVATESALLDAAPNGPVVRPLDSRQLAYILYTSGSTGRPKGVAVEHRSVVSMLNWARRIYDPAVLSGVLFSTSLCFDPSIFELFAPLCVGGRVIIVENILEAARLPAWSGITLINGVPSGVAELVRSNAVPASVRVVNLFGELLPIALVDKLHRLPQIESVYNLYGPTEDTVYSTFARVEMGENHIGRPIDGTRVHLLDADMERAPLGVPGELCLAGNGLARGYLDQPALTAERFLPDAFGAPGSRLYRTGDLARFREDGTIEFVGRIDDQVKIRGFRVEPGEIEAILRRQPTVQEAAVVARKNVNNETELAAFIVPAPDAEHSAVGTDHVERWRTVWDDTFAASGGSTTVGSTTGWNSSYDDLPMHVDDMQEFFAEAGALLRELPHERVLELGCGIGLIFDQLANSCRHYVGTDISAAALSQMRLRIAVQPTSATVDLLERPADKFEDIPCGTFDLVVIHSVAQYWPEINYFLRVVEGALRSLRPGGHLVIADLRNLRLQRAFHTSVAIAQAPADLPLSEIVRIVDERIAREPELLVDPALFAEFETRIAGVAAVEIHLKRGLARNELTKYRYDVILRAGEPTANKAPIHWIDGRTAALTLTDIKGLLEQADRRTMFGLLGLLDARLAAERHLLAPLEEQTMTTIGDLRARGPATRETTGIEPTALRELGRSTGWRVEIRPAREPGYIDVAFDAQGTLAGLTVFPNDAQADPWPIGYANQPTEFDQMQRLAEDLGPRLRESLAQQLPAHFIPASFAFIPALPRTLNGKLDRASLITRKTRHADARVLWVPPRSDTEIALAALWSDLLRVERIGANDNFFERGGHSLLVARLLHRLQHRFAVQLPLRRLFEMPTLGKLATEIDRARADRKTERVARATVIPPEVDADARLGPEMRGISECLPCRQSPRNLFVTGATGFVGCFLVDELLRRTDATLHCLVRGINAHESLSRLRARLRSFGLVEAADSTRIVPVPGDLSLPRFGLSEMGFDDLAECVDGILHAGALVNFIYPYEAMRQTNVEGTRQILILATRRRLKQVHHFSTIGVFGGRGAGLYVEDDSLADGVRARGGYSQSKWVAERLVAQARERGVPASIYRLGQITGHSVSGRGNDSSFLSRLISGCVDLGIAPDVNFTQDMTPVDYVAKAVVHLALHGGPPSNFHLMSRDRFNWRNLVAFISESNENLRLVPAPVWLEAVRNDVESPAASAIAPLLPMLSEVIADIDPTDQEEAEMHFDCRNVDTGVAGTGLCCPPLDAQLLRTYFLMRQPSHGTTAC
jgi:amino acid adenylation domain-containing protein/thioester reductase-like protein